MTEREKYPAITRDYDTLTGLILATPIDNIPKAQLQRCLDHLYHVAYEARTELEKLNQNLQSD